MTNQDFARSPWRKSSYSGSVGQECVEAAAVWRKSSHSEGSEGQCVEVAALPDRFIVLRDSKAPDGPRLSITPTAWASFLGDIKSGSLDAVR